MSWLRIASLQISFHPATTLEYTDFLSEPYIDAQGNHLLPHCAPKGVEQNIYTDIKQRIRSVYVESFKQRLTVLLDQCKEWEVEIALLPEYSVPWELLEYIANRYPTMCIVAGTHLVERSTLLSGTFRKLQLEDSKLPKPGNAVCPILFDKRLIALVSKIMPAQPERVSLLPGEIWLPVEIPGKSLPFGVLICLDFLFQRSQKHIVDILPQLNDCRYLVVPSLTREHSVPEFHAKLAEEVKRYGHPVIYSNISYGGGTTIGVDCGIHTPELSFPATIGVLPAKEEGVVVSDVNFSLRTLGPSTRYSDSLIAKPFALASLIYTNTEVGKNYEESIAPLNSIMKTDKADLEKLEQISSRIRQSGASNLLLKAAQFTRIKSLSGKIEKLLSIHSKINQLNELVPFIRDIFVPSSVLPHEDLEAALIEATRQSLERISAPSVEEISLREKLREIYAKIVRERNLTIAGKQIYEDTIHKAMLPSIMYSTRPSKLDFMISYAPGDMEAAHWISWHLRNVGHSVDVQERNFDRRSLSAELRYFTQQAYRSICLISPEFISRELYHNSPVEPIIPDGMPLGQFLTKCLFLNVRRCSTEDISRIIPLCPVNDLFGKDEGSLKALLFSYLRIGTMVSKPDFPIFMGDPEGSMDLYISVLTCPECGQDSLCIDGEEKVKCSNVDCKYEASPEQAASDYLSAICGINSYEMEKDGEPWPQYNCPECGVNAMVSTKDNRYICFSCGIQQSSARIAFCCDCNEPFSSQDDELRCSKCWGNILGSDRY